MMVGAPTSLEFPTRTRPVEPTTRLELHDRPVTASARSLTVGAGRSSASRGPRGMASGDCFAASSASASPAALSRSMARSCRGSLRRPRCSPGSASRAGIASGNRFSRPSRFSTMRRVNWAPLGPDGDFSTPTSGVKVPRCQRATEFVAGSPYMPVESLSGGNQQKVVLARPWLRKPEVLIVDEPTQGMMRRLASTSTRCCRRQPRTASECSVNSSDSGELQPPFAIGSTSCPRRSSSRRSSNPPPRARSFRASSLPRTCRRRRSSYASGRAYATGSIGCPRTLPSLFCSSSSPRWPSTRVVRPPCSGTPST